MKNCQCAWHSLPEGNYEGHLVIGQEQGGLYAGLIRRLTYQNGYAMLTPDPLYILNSTDNSWLHVKKPSDWGVAKSCPLHRHNLWRNFLVWSITHIGTIFIYSGTDSVQGFAEMGLPLCNELTKPSTSWRPCSILAIRGVIYYYQPLFLFLWIYTKMSSPRCTIGRSASGGKAGSNAPNQYSGFPFLREWQWLFHCSQMQTL